MTAAAEKLVAPEPANDNDDVLDVPGAMALLKLGRHAVYDGCARNEIPHRRIGRYLRFSRAALMRWLEGGPRGAQEGQ